MADTGYIYTPAQPAPIQSFLIAQTSRLVIVPGGVRFAIGSATFIDQGNGTLLTGLNPATGAGTVGGTINYQTHVVTLSPPRVGRVTVQSLLLYDPGMAESGVTTAYGRLPSAPISLGSFEIWGEALDGASFSGSADNNGVITGDAPIDSASSRLDHQTGFFRLVFSAPIQPQTLYFNAVSTYYLPLSSEEVGIDTVRFPPDGRVPVFRRGDVVFLSQQGTEALPSPLTPGQVINLSDLDVTHIQFAALRLIDSTGANVATTKFTANLALGQITMANPLDLSGYVQPLSAVWSVLDYARAVEVKVSGEIRLSLPLRHDCAEGTVVSSALLTGDRFARVANVFSQQTWTEQWSDERIGPAILAQYDNVNYPMLVTNEFAITDRWLGQVQSGSKLQISGERKGVLGQFSMQGDIAPINAVTGGPFFTIYAAGFGSLAGWPVGTCLRWNTIAFAAPFWTLRSARPSSPDVTGDGFTWGAVAAVNP